MFRFALSLWNHNDPILKERLFGLTGPQGNHGEDVKEYYFYLDATPTHSYLKMLYKYPQAAFPYADLVAETRHRGFNDFEYELLDTGIFDDHRYFDVFVEYAKADADDLLIKINAHNRGFDEAPLDLLPTIWFRNTWSWGYDTGPMGDVPSRPVLKHFNGSNAKSGVPLSHPAAGNYFFYAGGRNREWEHLNNFDVISLPDKWEYPWYAAWNLTFHAIPLALVDAAFAKRQLNLMAREWYMHPNGALPAYEWKFGDVNPPVHAWAAWMEFYCLVLLKIALALAKEDPVYQNTAGKFFEHFLRIARVMTGDYRGGLSLWNEEDSFFYDALHLPDGGKIPNQILLEIFNVEILIMS